MQTSKTTTARSREKAKTMPYDVGKVREDFPILQRQVNGKTIVYLDNAATTQKPREVIDSLVHYYSEYNANIHRGIYTISEEATSAHEEARAKVARFINASSPEEIVFLRGTTEAINLVAEAWGRQNLSPGDGIILSLMEHHSNIVPWQLLCREKRCTLKYIGITDDGHLDRADYRMQLESEGAKLVTISQMSNVLGTINPVREMIREAHKHGCRVLVDAAQSVPQMPVDVQDLDCDFLAFSGHKMCGPTGIGVLYAKKELLESMQPYQGGGEMIREVHMYDASWKDSPYKFEAGTTNISGAIGLGAAINYLNRIGMRKVRMHEEELTRYALDQMSGVKGISIYGPQDPTQRGGVISFNVGDIHAHDMATLLDEDSICVRSGHHCAQPLVERLGVPSTTRASFYLYNTIEEVDRLVESLEKARKVFKL